MNGQAQVTLPANQPLTVTLEAQHWGTLIGLLREVPAPHRVTDPLIQAISEQFQQAAQPLPNGADIGAHAEA